MGLRFKFYKVAELCHAIRLWCLAQHLHMAMGVSSAEICLREACADAVIGAEVSLSVCRWLTSSGTSPGQNHS